METRIGLVAGKEKWRIFPAQNIRFSDHIHRTFEIMAVEHGTVETAIDGKTYLLRQGECAAVFPLQHHSFSVSHTSLVKIYLFSEEVVPEFAQKVAGMLPKSPIFTLPEPLSVESDDAFSCRAFFYAVCARFLQRVTLEPTERSYLRCDPAEKLLLYIDEHYADQCDLRSAAQALGYEYTYLSKQFKASTGDSFREYLNRFRIHRACYRLYASDEAIAVVAADCGYGTQRTFNREFLRWMGITPSQYRAGRLMP